MNRNQKQSLWQTSICLLCAVLVFRELDYLGPSEFSGGSVTGPLFRLADAGSILFMLGLLLAFVFRRFAAGLSLVASLLCLPLYLYLMFPGASRMIFHGEYSIRLESNVILEKWLIVGLLALAISIFLCSRNLFAASNEEIPHRG
jgi:hypothetical protein